MRGQGRYHPEVQLQGIVMEESRLERLCIDKGMKMTEQRRIIARVLSDANDHPDVEEVSARCGAGFKNIHRHSLSDNATFRGRRDR